MLITTVLFTKTGMSELSLIL